MAHDVFGGFCGVAWTNVGSCVAADRGLAATKPSCIVTDHVVRCNVPDGGSLQCSRGALKRSRGWFVATFQGGDPLQRSMGVVRCNVPGPSRKAHVMVRKTSLSESEPCS